jgi:hypothetical protein
MNISLLPPDLSQLKNLVFLDLSNNPISDYQKVGKSLSTINNLQQLRIDLTTVDNVEIILRNLPNLKMLNDKPIQANLFSQENESQNPTQNNNLSDNINNINNNEVISDENNNEQKDLPDSSIENEIANYDVRIYMYLLFNI